MVGSLLGLVGLVSVRSYWVREQVAASLPVWHFTKLSWQICLWDALRVLLGSKGTTGQCEIKGVLCGWKSHVLSRLLISFGRSVCGMLFASYWKVKEPLDNVKLRVSSVAESHMSCSGYWSALGSVLSFLFFLVSWLELMRWLYWWDFGIWFATVQVITLQLGVLVWGEEVFGKNASEWADKVERQWKQCKREGRKQRRKWREKKNLEPRAWDCRAGDEPISVGLGPSCAFPVQHSGCLMLCPPFHLVVHSPVYFSQIITKCLTLPHGLQGRQTRMAFQLLQVLSWSPTANYLVNDWLLVETHFHFMSKL